MKKFTQKKQLTAVIMAASLAFASLTGCSSSSAGKEPAGQETEAAVNVSLDDVLNKIKEAYGEGYIPNTPMDDQMLNDVIGLSPELCESYVAEMPMIAPSWRPSSE